MGFKHVLMNFYESQPELLLMYQVHQNSPNEEAECLKGHNPTLK